MNPIRIASFLFLTTSVFAVNALGGKLANLTTNVFDNTSISHRHDFCTRFRDLYNTDSNNLDISKALKGAELSVWLIVDEYFHYDKITGINDTYPGINAQMLDYMAERGNFTWRNSFGVLLPEEFEAALESYNFSDLAMWGVDNFDVVAVALAPSQERKKRGINFVSGHYDGSLIMVLNEEPPKDTVNWFSIWKPFTWNVWLTIIGVIIFSSIAYQFIEAIGAQRDHEVSFRKWLMNSLYLSFINFTGNYSYEPISLGGRVFGVSFAFWAMLITAEYTANLASILVVTNTPGPSVKNLDDAIDQRLKICTQKGSYSEGYLKRQYPEAVEFMVPITETDEKYNSLNQGKCDVLVGYRQEFHTKQMQKEFNPTCTLQWVGRTIKVLSDGFATKLDAGVMCTDLVNEVVSYYISEMKENGFLEEKWNEFEAHDATPGHCGYTLEDVTTSGRRRRLQEGGGGSTDGTSDSTDSLALDIVDMASTMLWQMMGSVVAILIALFSNCDRKTKRKIESRKDVMKMSRESSLAPSVKKETCVVVDEAATSDGIKKQLDEICRGLEDLTKTVSQLQQEIHSKR